jgi:hypothetical protein
MRLTPLVQQELLANAPKDPSQDIFSLGVLLQEIAFDVPPPAEGELWQRVREGRLLDSHVTRSDALRRLVSLVRRREVCWSGHGMPSI